MGKEDADGYVRVKLDVDTSETKQMEMALKDIQELAELAKRKIDELKKAGIDESTPAYREAAADLEKYNTVLEKYRKEKEKAASAPEINTNAGKTTGIKTGDFNSISDEVEDYATRLRMLRDKGFGPGDTRFDNVYIGWKNAANAEKEYFSQLDKQTEKGIEREAEKARKEAEQAAEYEHLNRLRVDAQVHDKNLVKLLEQQETITARMAELKRAGAGEGYKEYDQLNQQLKNVNQRISLVRHGMSQVKKGANKMASGLTKTTGRLSGMFKTMALRLTLNMLVFSWISKAFQNIFAGIKDGFKNLASYSKSYNKVMSDYKSAAAELKNNFAAAFEPLVNTVMPYLTMFVNGLNTAMESLSRFMAYMGGKNTYTRAKKQLIDYKNAVDSTSQSLAKFDKLTVLNDNNNTAGGEKTGADAFETVDLGEVPDTFKNFKEAYETYIQPVLNGFKEAVRWLGKNAGNAFKHIFSTALESAKELWNSIVNLFEKASPYMSAFSENMQKLFTILFEALAAIWDVTGKPIFIFMMQALQGTIDYFTDHIGEISDAFGKFVESMDEDWKMLQPAMQEVSENMQRLFSVFLEALGTIWDSIGRPVFNFIVLALQETIDFFSEHAGEMSDAFKNFVDKVEDSWQNYLRPVFEAIGTFLEDILLPVFNGVFKDGILPAVWDTFEAINSLIQDSLIPAFDGICEFLEGVFTLNFEKALNGIKDIVRGIINGIIAIVEGGANLVIDGINAIIGGWNSIASKLHVPEIDLVGKVSLPKLQDDGNWSMSSKNNTTRNYNSETGRIYGGHRVSSDSGGSVYYGNAQTGYKSSDLTSWKNNNNLSNDVKSGSRIGENNTYTFVAQLDGKTIYKEVVNQDKMQKNRTGRSALSD